MRAIFRLYLPHVRYRSANIDRQVESNGLPSRWKSKFMVGPAPLMEFENAGIYPQKRAEQGPRVVPGALSAHHRRRVRARLVRSRTCASESACSATESSKNDFFIAPLRIRQQRGSRAVDVEHGVQRSEKVVWKIGPPNRIISFDSRRRFVPRDHRRDRLLSSILIRASPWLGGRAIREYQIFARVSGESREHRRLSLSICYSLCK